MAAFACENYLTSGKKHDRMNLCAKSGIGPNIYAGPDNRSKSDEVSSVIKPLLLSLSIVIKFEKGVFLEAFLLDNDDFCKIIGTLRSANIV